MSREVAKRALLATVKARLPAVLATARARAAAATWPWPDEPPDPTLYALRSKLPTLATEFPCVLVEEVGAPRREFQTAERTGGHQTVYGLVLSVATRALADELERAETMRDRLVDAVLEVLHTSDLGGGVRIVPGSLTDETGLAAENGATASVAAAQVTFQVVADEQYADPAVTAERVTTIVQPTPDQT